MSKFSIDEIVIVPFDNPETGRQFKLGRVIQVNKNVVYDELKIQIGLGEIIDRLEPYVDKIQNTDEFTIIPHVTEEEKDFIFSCPARELAADILSDADLTGDEYYNVEDYLTDALNGNGIGDFPYINHYKISLKEQINQVLTSKTWSDNRRDINYHFVNEDDFVEMIAQSFVDEDLRPLLSEVEERMNLYLAYYKYRFKWHNEHDEGEPADINEFFMNEWQDLDSQNYYGFKHLVSKN